MAPEAPWTLTIPSDLRLLTLARSFVESVCRVAGFDERATRAIVMATDEATNNVIRHAHRDNPEAALQIECHFVNEGIEVRLLDEGAPFDIAAVPHMDPAELRVGGRGVFLMRALMDELSCQPRGERGNLLRMVKRCNRPVSAVDTSSPPTAPPLPRT
jgi:serine/threonine-protein kinase RsbW